MILYLLAAIGGFVLGIWFLIACCTWYLMFTDWLVMRRYNRDSR